MSQAESQPTLREVNIESRRQRILEAARSLIAGGGMQSLSMRKLAAESGLAVVGLSSASWLLTRAAASAIWPAWGPDERM